ncbi:hypothetical protein [Streptococcus dentiloxodontae]
MNQTNYDLVANAIYHQTDRLTENTIKNQIFQIELDLAKADSVEEKLALEKLLRFYKGKLEEFKRKQRNRRLVTAVLLCIALIGGYLVFRFYSDSQSAQAGRTMSSSLSSTSTVTSSASSSTSSSSSSVNSVVPASAVGTWTGTIWNQSASLTIAEDGKVTKIHGNYTTIGQITSYEEVGKNLYRFYFANDSDTSSIVFDQLGGIQIEYAFGIYISGNILYTQYWQKPMGGSFTYTARTDGSKALTKNGSAIDTTKLTDEQVKDWVLRTYFASNNISSRSDYFVNVKLYNNLVYASVRKNSAPDTRIALYRVNADGELEEGNLDDTNWHVVSTSYSG